jgi:hypothetical protein
MSQKYFFVVDYFVTSGDGGLLNVIAESEDECFDLIVQWDNESWPEFYPKLRENIQRASRFALADENEESYVVEAFVP